MQLPPFSTIIEQHGLAVLRLCRALVDDNEADDAYAESMLSALQAYPSLRNAENLEGWLISIAYRRCMDARRTLVRDRSLADAAAQRTRSEKTQRIALAPLLEPLSSQQREVVMLHYIAGFQHAEIAGMLGKSPAAIRKSASEAIATLRATFPSLIDLELIAGHEMSTP